MWTVQCAASCHPSVVDCAACLPSVVDCAACLPSYGLCGALRNVAALDLLQDATSAAAFERALSPCVAGPESCHSAAVTTAAPGCVISESVWDGAGAALEDGATTGQV